MNNSELAHDYHSILTSIEILEKRWNNIDSLEAVWPSVYDLLNAFGCKNVCFYSRSLVGAKFETKPVIYHLTIGAEVEVAQIFLTEDDNSRFTTKLKKNRLSQFLSVSDLSASPFEGLKDQRLFLCYEKSESPNYVARHYYPNSFTGYTVFNTKKKSFFSEKIFRNVLFSLLASIHEKIDEFYALQNQKFIRLSARENDVLNLLTHGKTNSEIAEHLSISSYTVSSYVKVLGLKLRSTNRSSTVFRALSLGLVRI